MSCAAGGAPVYLINSIYIDPSRARTYPEVEIQIKEQLKSSARKFEKLKATVSSLVKYTRDIKGFTDIDLLEKRANRLKPNMDVVRSLRLTKYILATMIYLTRGDERYIEGMKPGEEFFKTHPQLDEIVRRRKDVDTVLLALYNESPRKFVADTSPLYRIPRLLEQILVPHPRRPSRMISHSFHTQSMQFEESMCTLTGAVLRLLFNVKESDTDMDIMLFFIRSRGARPVRLKRVFSDGVKRINRKIDHSLFLLKEAANYVLEETERNPSFIQQVLNQSYVENVLESSRQLLKDVDALDSLLDGLSRLKADMVHLCWTIRDRTSEKTARLNRMMDSSAYRDLLLLSRDMKDAGNAFFTDLQDVYGFFVAYAAQSRIGLDELLGRLEGSFTSHFTAIDDYLRFIPDFEKKLDSFRNSYGQLTLIEEGRSEFYKTLIHEMSQVCINFTTSIARGKLFHKHLKAFEDFELLYDPLYGDRIANITEPIIALRQTFPAESKFNLTRFMGRDSVVPDAMRNSYRKIMRLQLCADAILEFYGNLIDNDRYMFDVSAVKQESSNLRRHLDEIVRYCTAYDDAPREKED